MKKEKELSLEKIYDLQDYKIVFHSNVAFAIWANMAKWIILYNEDQIEILASLKDSISINSIIESQKYAEEDLIWVLTKLEAKSIETTNVKSIFDNKKLHLHLTNKCNMRCPHCYMESGRAYENELTTEQIKKLCQDFASFGGTDVSLTGGEPTVREDFFEIVEFISNLGMKISVFTNGVLWTEEMVKKLSQFLLDGVQISIDGYDETTNAKIRGKGSFEKALAAVDLFVKHKIKVKIAITAPYEIAKNGKEKYVAFSKNLIEKYGQDAIDINYSYFFMTGRNLSLEQVEAQKQEYYSIIDSIVFEIYGDLSENTFVDNLIDDAIFDSCGYGGLNVMANGDFYFCDRIPDVSNVGNITKLPFSEIFRLMKVAEEKGKIDNFKPCGNCELRYICGGGCRAEYFKDFTKIKNIEEIDFSKISPRICTEKERIYDLMLKTNERFFG